MIRCKQCKFWHPAQKQCRIKAPSWPTTRPDDFCGEGRHKRAVIKADFFGRFTLPEQQAMQDLKDSGDQVMEIFSRHVDMCDLINLDHSLVIQALDYLSSNPADSPVLIEGRKSEILS